MHLHSIPILRPLRQADTTALLIHEPTFGGYFTGRAANKCRIGGFLVYDLRGTLFYTEARYYRVHLSTNNAAKI